MTEERLLARFDTPVLREYLNRKAGEYGLGSVELFVAPRERTVTVVTRRFPARTFTATSTELAAHAFAAEDASTVLDLGKHGEIVRAVVPVYSSDGDKRVEAVVAVSYYIPQSLAAKSDGDPRRL